MQKLQKKYENRKEKKKKEEKKGEMDRTAQSGPTSLDQLNLPEPVPFYFFFFPG
jgi:hypothetical protein